MSQMPPPGSPPPPGGPGPGAPIKTYLVEAILVTLCCCLPLGIVSIVFAAQASSKQGAGDTVGAQEAAGKAKQFAMWGLIGGIIIWVIVLAFYGLAIMAALSGASAQ